MTKKELNVNNVLNNALTKDSIQRTLDDFTKTDLDETRFVILFGVRQDGTSYFYHVGCITGMEVTALPTVLEDIAAYVDEERNMATAESDNKE